jgi:large subunit ribosomal protein L9
MRVVLRSDLDGIGKRGDVVDVADGHARNYLLPGGYAFPASAKVLDQASKMRHARDVADERARQAAESIAQQLVPVAISITARVGRNGRLFGSVTAAEIVAAVEAQTGIAVDRHKLVMREPIRSVGTHEVGVRLHPDVEFALTLEVSG